MVEEDIIFPILPRRIDASVQRRYQNEEPEEAKLFYRRPTHVPSHSTSSAGSSSSNNPLYISKNKGDVSRSGVQPTSSRRASVPFQPFSVSRLAQDSFEGTYSTNLPLTGSSRPSSATNRPRRMTAGRDKPLPPPPSFKNGAFNNFGSDPDAPARTSLAQPGKTSSSHPGDIWRVSGTTNFKSVQSIRPTSAQNPQRSSPNVHSIAFAMIGRRPKSARESRPPKEEWVATAVPPRQPLSSRVPRSQSVEPVTRHEHAVLEVLFKSVFEGRFINTSPTAILPSYLNTYFKNLIASPRVDMPTPPAPERRIKDIFGTEDVNMVPLKPALEGPLQPAAAIVNRYPAPQTHHRSRLLSRSASMPFDPAELLPRPQKHPSASSESEESDPAYWSARSLVTPITPPGQLKGIELVKGEKHPGENNKGTHSLSLLTMFDEEDDAREAITSPTSNWVRHPPETKLSPESEAPITLDAALAAIERHDHFYNEPLSALRRGVDIGSIKSTYQRKQPRCPAEKYVSQSHTRVKARDSAGSALCLVLPRALFKLDERDMGLHLRKTYMGEFQLFLPDYPLRARDSLSISRCHRLSRSHVGGTATPSQGCHWRTWILPNNVAGSGSVVISGTLDERCREV